MKMLLSAAAVALAMGSLPAWSQTTTSPTNDQLQNAPGTGGTSKPGVAGQTGNKSGPAAQQSGTSASRSLTGTTTSPSQDESKVQGMPGNKSGPSNRAPGQKEQEPKSR